MADRRAEGLYGKFEVHRTDGTDAVGEKHHGCTYFVLDLQHDKHMPAALRAYADSCEAEYPALARDLRTVANDFYPPFGQFSGITAQKPAFDLERRSTALRACAEAPALSIQKEPGMEIIDIDDVPHPTAELCYAQAPDMRRCDRKAGHGGLHTWAMSAEAPATDKDPLLYFVTEVLKSFEASEAAGYHTRDREYAIDMLKKGLEVRAEALAPSPDTGQEPTSAEATFVHAVRRDALQRFGHEGQARVLAALCATP